MSSPADKADNAYVCVVEIPKGNRNKYEFALSSAGSSSIAC